MRTRPPSLGVERELWGSGHDVVVGVDEVGRGAWAGPLSVGAAVLPRDRRVYKVRDSKALTEAERERSSHASPRGASRGRSGMRAQAECDEIGMADAQRLAAQRAIEGSGVVPDAIVVDGKWDFVSRAAPTAKMHRIVKADATCLSVSTASVLAKVTRDRMMRAESEHFPGYDFDANKGYPCPRHKAALAAWGPTSIHRRTWVFMDHLPWPGMRVLRPEQAQLFEA